MRRFIVCIGTRGLSFGRDPLVKTTHSSTWTFTVGRENLPGEWP